MPPVMSGTPERTQPSFIQTAACIFGRSIAPMTTSRSCTTSATSSAELRRSSTASSFHPRVERSDAGFRELDLAAADVGLRVEDLPVQVGELDAVEVDDAQVADAH